MACNWICAWDMLRRAARCRVLGAHQSVWARVSLYALIDSSAERFLPVSLPPINSNSTQTLPYATRHPRVSLPLSCHPDGDLPTTSSPRCDAQNKRWTSPRDPWIISTGKPIAARPTRVVPTPLADLRRRQRLARVRCQVTAAHEVDSQLLTSHSRSLPGSFRRRRRTPKLASEPLELAKRDTPRRTTRKCRPVPTRTRFPWSSLLKLLSDPLRRRSPAPLELASSWTSSASATPRQPPSRTLPASPPPPPPPQARPQPRPHRSRTR